LRPAALKSLSRLGRTDRERILAALGRLPEGDVRRLVGTVGLYRLRVGDWRAISGAMTRNGRSPSPKSCPGKALTSSFESTSLGGPGG
jgi:hypothetical protein